MSATKAFLSTRPPAASSTDRQPCFTYCYNCGTCDHRGYVCPCGCHPIGSPRKGLRNRSALAVAEVHRILAETEPREDSEGRVWVIGTKRLSRWGHIETGRALAESLAAFVALESL